MNHFLILSWYCYCIWSKRKPNIMVADRFITSFFLKNLNSAQVHLFVDFNVCRVFYQLWIGTAKKETFIEGKFCSLAWNLSRNKGPHFQHIRELTVLWVIWNYFHMTHRSVSCYTFSNKLKIGFYLTSY